MQNLSNPPPKQIITYPDDVKLNVTQPKATFIIQRAGRPMRPLNTDRHSTVVSSTGETTLNDLPSRKRHDSTPALFTRFPLCSSYLLPSPDCPESSQRVERECSRTEENWSDKDSRPTVQICLHIEGPRLLYGQRP